MVYGAPLAGFFVHDELPGGAGGSRKAVQGVFAGGDMERADGEVSFGGEAGGGVGAGAPDLAVGDQAAHDAAAADRGRVVMQNYGFAVELGFGGFGGRGERLAVLRLTVILDRDGGAGSGGRLRLGVGK